MPSEKRLEQGEPRAEGEDEWVGEEGLQKSLIRQRKKSVDGVAESRIGESVPGG